MKRRIDEGVPGLLAFLLWAVPTALIAACLFQGCGGGTAATGRAGEETKVQATEVSVDNA